MVYKGPDEAVPTLVPVLVESLDMEDFVDSADTVELVDVLRFEA